MRTKRNRAPHLSAVLRAVAQVNQDFGGAAPLMIHSRVTGTRPDIEASIKAAVSRKLLHTYGSETAPEYFITTSGGDLLDRERRATPREVMA